MIPAEAVEAAAKVLFKAQTFNDWEPLNHNIKRIWLDKARAALEAAEASRRVLQPINQIGRAHV